MSHSTPPDELRRNHASRGKPVGMGCVSERGASARGWLACLQGGPERAVVRVREIGLGLRCGWCQRLHLLGEIVEERPARGAERGGESALGKVRPVSLHGRRSCCCCAESVFGKAAVGRSITYWI